MWNKFSILGGRLRLARANKVGGGLQLLSAFNAICLLYLELSNSSMHSSSADFEPYASPGLSECERRIPRRAQYLFQQADDIDD